MLCLGLYNSCERSRFLSLQYEDTIVRWKDCTGESTTLSSFLFKPMFGHKFLTCEGSFLLAVWDRRSVWTCRQFSWIQKCSSEENRGHGCFCSCRKCSKTLERLWRMCQKETFKNTSQTLTSSSLLLLRRWALLRSSRLIHSWIYWWDFLSPSSALGSLNTVSWQNVLQSVKRRVQKAQSLQTKHKCESSRLSRVRDTECLACQAGLCMTSLQVTKRILLLHYFIPVFSSRVVILKCFLALDLSTCNYFNSLPYHGQCPSWLLVLKIANWKSRHRHRKLEAVYAEPGLYHL